MAYTAIIGRIKTKPHPNADRIQLGVIYGEQVIVGLDTQDGELGVFFPCDGQLSEAFADANDLVGYKDPETGEKKGGYFGKNRRVRAQNFRGEKSDGFYCPLDYLRAVPDLKEKVVDALKDGDQFTELDGVEICRKYVTPATKSQRNKVKVKKVQRSMIGFPEHMDTKQFKYEIRKIPKGSLLYITEKVHGTSGRYAHALEELPLTWFQKVKKFFGFKPENKQVYKYVVGSRRVVLADKSSPSFYGDETFRTKILEELRGNLRRGEIIYLELVGYTTTGASIMPSHGTDGLKDKKFTKQYGPMIHYKYGCPEGTCRPIVYRIAHSDPDGHVIDLPWAQVKERAKELGLETVPDMINGPLIYMGTRGDHTGEEYIRYQFGDREVYDYELEDLVSQIVSGPSLIDASHIREGIVVRIEYAGGTYFLKDKSFEFKVLEGIIKNQEDYIDTEEAS